MKSNLPNQFVKFGLWGRLIRDLRLLFSLIKDYWKGNYRQVSIGSIVVFVFTVIYILCPVDLISDLIPFVGQIDDALILLLCLYYLEKDLYKYNKWKKGQKDNSSKAP